MRTTGYNTYCELNFIVLRVYKRRDLFPIFINADLAKMDNDQDMNMEDSPIGSPPETSPVVSPIEPFDINDVTRDVTHEDEKSNYYAITGWERHNPRSDFIDWVKANDKDIKHGLVSASHRKCTQSSTLHYHVHIQFYKGFRISHFGKLNDTCWIRPIKGKKQKDGKVDTLAIAVQKYLHYCIGKGTFYEHNKENRPKGVLTNPRTKPKKVKAQIEAQVRAGRRRLEILDDFPGCHDIIVKLMCLRPLRTSENLCDVLHLHGPTGKGKTSEVGRVLEATEKLYPQMDWYSKLEGENSKFWDGYDNQPIVVFDDVNIEDTPYSRMVISGMKKVLGTSIRTTVEIKYGSVAFDSSLVIITSNPGPNELASACGAGNRAAMLRRFKDTQGSHYVESAKTMKLIVKRVLIPALMEIAARRFPEIEFDPVKVYDTYKALPPKRKPIPKGITIKPAIEYNTDSEEEEPLPRETRSTQTPDSIPEPTENYYEEPPNKKRKVEDTMVQTTIMTPPKKLTFKFIREKDFSGKTLYRFRNNLSGKEKWIGWEDMDSDQVALYYQAVGNDILTNQ